MKAQNCVVWPERLLACLIFNLLHLALAVKAGNARELIQNSEIADYICFLNRHFKLLHPVIKVPFALTSNICQRTFSVPLTHWPPNHPWNSLKFPIPAPHAALHSIAGHALMSRCQLQLRQNGIVTLCKTQQHGAARPRYWMLQGCWGQKVRSEWETKSCRFNVCLDGRMRNSSPCLLTQCLRLRQVVLWCQVTHPSRAAEAGWPWSLCAGCVAAPCDHLLKCVAKELQPSTYKVNLKVKEDDGTEWLCTSNCMMDQLNRLSFWICILDPLPRHQLLSALPSVSGPPCKTPQDTTVSVDKQCECMERSENCAIP